MKEKELSYQDYVSLGKKLVEEVEDKQIKICMYAMKVCTIRHGGISKGFYTITDYAKDIGIKPKTLQNWLCVYRNVILKLRPDQKAVWQQASRANAVLEENRNMDNAIKGTVGRRKSNPRNLPSEKVQKIYDQFVDGKPFIAEFTGMVQYAKRLKGILNARDLSIIPDAQMLLYMNLLDECSDIINDHLTKKKRGAA